MNEERTELCLWQTEHFRGYLWQMTTTLFDWEIHYHYLLSQHIHAQRITQLVHIAIRKVNRYQRGYTEAVYRRRTDNAIAKTQGQNNDLHNTTQKTKDIATRTPLKTMWTQVLRKGAQFLLHIIHPSFIIEC